MVNILAYIGILLFTLFRKVFGLAWFWVIVWFRKYARNVVYNYKLQNNLWLKRLKERPIVDEVSHYRIQPFHGADGGYITKRGVSKMEYLFTYWFIWGWLDDDSNYDTCDLGFIEKVLTGEHPKPLTVKLFGKYLRGSVQKMKSGLYGNTFDIGDTRSKDPMLFFWASWLWLVRNTAYNFKYDQFESDTQHFYFRILGYGFGWEPTDIVGGTQNYQLVHFDK